MDSDTASNDELVLALTPGQLLLVVLGLVVVFVVVRAKKAR